VANDTVTVNVTPVPQPTVETFDHNNPPPDLKPGEAADASFDVGVNGAAYGYSFDGTTITVTSVGAVTVTGTTTIRLPDNANQTLKDHENGHHALSKDEYDRTAKKKGEDAVRGFKGMKFTGEGDTPEKRKESALAKADAERDRRLNRATNSISDQSDTLNKKYDDLTKHGTSDKINTQQGINMAKKERDKAPAAGGNALQPKKPIAGTNDPPLVRYDSITDKLHFELPSPLIFTNSGASDAILGAYVSIDPLQVIGVQENGSMHLGTSEMKVTKDGITVLHGYLWEMAYMPSSMDSFAGMIQGYLDIPPAFTGEGIINDIGSIFLDDYQKILDTETDFLKSTFWFFTDQGIFDNSGYILVTESTGNLKFGIGVIPEPSTLLLLGSGLAGLVGFGRKRLFKKS